MSEINKEDEGLADSIFRATPMYFEPAGRVREAYKLGIHRGVVGAQEALQASRQSAEDRDGETIAYLLGFEEGKDKAKEEIKRYREALERIASSDHGPIGLRNIAKDALCWARKIDPAEALNQGEKE